MLDRRTSREVLATAVQDAYIVLQETPDAPMFVPAAERLARKLLQLDEYLSQLDAQVKTATPPSYRAAPSWYRPEP